jgi:hypothetical protein
LSVLYGLPVPTKLELAGLRVHATHAPSLSAEQLPRYSPAAHCTWLHGAQVLPLLK